jgi:hypothetical protein
VFFVDLAYARDMTAVQTDTEIVSDVLELRESLRCDSSIHRHHLVGRALLQIVL